MTEATSLWTDERIVLLRKLWAEGVTSGAIAVQFGVTRNAIIGKVNRLGLMGHRKPDATKRQPRQAWTEERLGRLAELVRAGTGFARIAKELGGVSKDTCEARARRDGLLPTRHEAFVEIPVDEAYSDEAEVIEVSSVREAIQVQTFLRDASGGRPVAEATDELPWRPVEEPAGGPVSILGLREGVCRWPVGDPRKPGFHFCGGEAIKGKPYCVGHAVVAFVRPEQRRGTAWTPDRIQQARARSSAMFQNRRPGRKSTKFAVPAE